jgi:hypothetical protein
VIKVTSGLHHAYAIERERGLIEVLLARLTQTRIESLHAVSR